MKFIIASSLSILLSSVAIPSDASAFFFQEDSTSIQDSPSLEQVLERSMAQENTVAPLRAELLSDISKTMGFRAGWVKRSLEIRREVQDYEKHLDALFVFSPLISRDGVLPPVIVEAQDVTSLSDDQIRTADRVYSFAAKERFVSVPPTWRDYLFVGLATKQTSVQVAHEVFPENKDEEIIWERGIRKGWEEGMASAEAIMDKNFNRLVRDYTGMIRYARLMQADMVVPTTIATSREAVTGNDQEVVIGETHKRIVQPSRFDVDSGKWVPIIAHPASNRK